MKVVLDGRQVVQWPHVSPKDFILPMLGQGAFSKSPSHMSEGSNQSTSERSFSLSVKTDRHCWFHCSNLASIGISAHSLTNPIAPRAVVVHMGEAGHAQKISYEHDFDKGVWMAVSSTTCMWSLRTRQNQMCNFWIYRWKRRMKNWTKPTMDYEQFGRHWGTLGVPRLLNRG